MTANGAAIRSIRTKLGRSLRAAAADAGVSPGYLAQVERGERSPRTVTLQAIADALGAPLEAITRERSMTTAIDEANELRLYKPEQVAELWGVSKSWLQKAAAAGEIEATYLRLGGRSKGLLRFSEAQVRKILAGFTVQPTSSPSSKPRRKAA